MPTNFASRVSTYPPQGYVNYSEPKDRLWKSHVLSFGTGSGKYPELVSPERKRDPYELINPRKKSGNKRELFASYLRQHDVWRDAPSSGIALSWAIGVTMSRSVSSWWFEQISGRRNAGQPATLPVYPLRL